MTLILLLLSLNACGVLAQEVPKLKLETYYLDLGQVKIKNSKKWSLNVKNEGSGILRLAEVDPNCSCVKVTSFAEELLPGEVGKIEGYVKSGSKGEVMKFITIRSNDKSGPQKLSVRADFI